MVNAMNFNVTFVCSPFTNNQAWNFDATKNWYIRSCAASKLQSNKSVEEFTIVILHVNYENNMRLIMMGIMVNYAEKSILIG